MMSKGSMAKSSSPKPNAQPFRKDQKPLIMREGRLPPRQEKSQRTGAMP